MEQVNKFAEKLLEYLNGAEAFLKTQMPDFVNQFVAYETWRTEWYFTVLLVVLIALIILQVAWITKCFMRSEENDSWAVVGIGLAGMFALYTCIGSYANMKKLQIAPKVYMVEAAKKLVMEPKK